MRKTLFVWAVLLGSLAACEQFPRDPRHTLQEVTNGTLEVGYSVNPPWVVRGEQEPKGIEPALVRAFAESINAKVQWTYGTEQDLFERLEKNELHLVIAGTTEKTPWRKKVAFSRPYVQWQDKKHVMGVIKGENAFVVALEKFLHQHPLP